MTQEEGVFYPIEGYAGVWLRLMIELIDTSIVIVVSVLCIGVGSVFVLVGFIPAGESLSLTIVVSLSLIWFGYFVLLKRSKLGTVGYRIGHTKLVNLQGNNPSLYCLTLRLIFAVIGPLNILLDLLWIPGDPCQQSLRDKFAHTYVIKRDSKVAGRGKIVFRRYSVWGWNLLFQEVDPTAKPKND